MISHENKFIFIHVPKNAGTSIDECLEQMGCDGRKKNFESHYDNISPEIAKEYFIFAVKRNPWDRAVSIYLFWKRLIGILPELKKEFEDPEVWTFKHFCKNYQEFSEKIIKRKPKEFVHFIPQIKINNQPKYVRVDFWIEFENLQRGFDEVCDKIKLPRKILPHLNKRERTSYRDYYDDESKEIIARIFKEDIDFFGYKF